MKFTFKKLILVLIISASIPLIVSHLPQIYESLYLATSNLNQQYTAELKSKLDVINKNKDDIEELSLEIKSKKNDLYMEAESIRHTESTVALKEKDILSLDQQSMNDLISQFDNLSKNIKIHKENKDYSTLLNDMNNLIALQKNKYDLLKKVDLDLDTALGVLK